MHDGKKREKLSRNTLSGRITLTVQGKHLPAEGAFFLFSLISKPGQ
jgi:hypothetical protein